MSPSIVRLTDASTIGQSWACFCLASYEAFFPLAAGIMTLVTSSPGATVISRSFSVFGTWYRSSTGTVRSPFGPTIVALAPRAISGTARLDGLTKRASPSVMKIAW